MPSNGESRVHLGNILIVDDEWDSAPMRSVRRKMEEEGWNTVVVKPKTGWNQGQDFEDATLYALEAQPPDGVLLDVRFGDDKEDQYKGLGILQKIVSRYPKLPVLMYTQYAQGPQREIAVRSTLKWDAPVDFIDKMASPEEVLLRLRRLLGRSPQNILIGDRIMVDTKGKLVLVENGGSWGPVDEIIGMRFEVLRELATMWYRSPGELVRFNRLERYSEGEDARASLRVRVREIKDALGKALNARFGANDLIINVRDQGYRLVPPRL